MTRREVRGLKWARFGPKPHYLTSQKQRGLRAKGLAYERKVGKALLLDHPNALLGQWIYFEDFKGPGVAQPDILLTLGNSLHIIECKLSYKEEAEEKIRRVYGTLLRHIYPDHVLHFTQVFRNFNGYAGDVTLWKDLFDARVPDDYALCHHIP